MKCITFTFVKTILTYGFSLLMILTFLVNTQGIFVEHHDCNSGCCEVEMHEEDTQSHDCGIDAHTCCSSHDFEDFTSDSHAYCDLSNKDHQSSCSCFAEYFQIPVFISEINKHKNIPSQTIVLASIFLNQNIPNSFKELYTVGYHAPPDKKAQNLKLNILNCTFLC